MRITLRSYFFEFSRLGVTLLDLTLPLALTLRKLPFSPPYIYAMLLTFEKVDT